MCFSGQKNAIGLVKLRNVAIHVLTLDTAGLDNKCYCFFERKILTLKTFWIFLPNNNFIEWRQSVETCKENA
jgi:hypothetical protein